MTLGKLILYIGIIAVLLTFAVKIFRRKDDNLLITFLQNFCGALFVFSGWVKAVDPLGTAYKMEQYFAEFESTFSETFLSFLAPLFPWFSEHSISFSVVMVVFEIVLGLLLLVGSRSKLTSWAFLLLVAFFTALTGFTYLTGYVPNGVNFFEFGNWGDWVETNMKVTDCGCFGDFLVLEPKVSFLKDVFLLVPGVLFVLASKAENQLENNIQRAILVGITVLASLGIILINGYPVGWGALLAAIALIGAQMAGKKSSMWISAAIILIYCLSNFVWDIPTADFRPFREGVNVRAQKALEEEAENNIEIIAYKATNKADGKVVEIPFDQYLKEFKKYPKEEWNLEQIKTEPTVPRSKISDFDLSNNEGESMTEEILSNPNYSFMIVAYKLKYDSEMKEMTVQDTTWRMDTLTVEGFEDSLQIQKVVDAINPRTFRQEIYKFDEDYLKNWTEIVNPVLAKAKENGISSFAVTAYASPDLLASFAETINADYPIYQGDDILLKTIVRSNPGIVLMKDGAVVNKWHYKKLPSWEEIQDLMK